MNTKLKFGLSQIGQYAPRWVINATSVIALLIVAKHHIIDGIPELSDALKASLNSWIDYVLDLMQVALAIAVIFFGEHRENKPNHDSLRN